MPGNATATNDHTDFRWDERVIGTLGGLGRRLGPVNADLAGVLHRFDGYSGRYDAALTRVIRGEHHWVDGIAVDSCHLVWMQLHEDLIATLGVTRGDQR